MTVATSLYTFLSGNGTITAITTAIHPQVLPQEVAFPALTYTMDADDDDYLLSGSASGLKEALFSIDCYSPSYVTAHTLADAVRGELIGVTGTFGAVTADHIRKEREFDLFEPPTELHRVSMEFFVAYC